MVSTRFVAALGLALVAGGACAPASTQTSAGPAPAAPSAPLPRELHWARDAAEHDALFLQVYRAAAEQVDRLSAGLARGTWAVILDADETVLDNSAYYLEQSRGRPVQPPFDPVRWNAWVRRAEATALPGAAGFIAHVAELGGHVVIVTNRDEVVCAATSDNLKRLGLDVDAVLCRPPQSGDKNPRYEAVQRGTTPAGLPPLTVIMWIGDNIQDFPRLTQDVRHRGPAALADFGVRYFLLPNPMYGSWEGNPAR